jgi:rpsU-divergently transcribed protein
MKDWENRLAVEVQLRDIQGKPFDEQLFHVIQRRLSYEIEYMPNWKDAMILGLQPHNVLSTYENLFNNMNTICEVLGDESTGLEWYAKRFSVGKLFVCTETYMLKDKSPNFESSWKMLEEMINKIDENTFKDMTKFGTWGLCSAYKGLMFNLK